MAAKNQKTQDAKTNGEDVTAPEETTIETPAQNQAAEETKIETPGQTQAGHPDQAKTNGEDVTALVHANAQAQAKEREEAIEAEVQKRLKQHLKEKDSTAIILEPEEYEPRHQKTRVPMHDKAHTDPFGWETVEKEDFTADHAKALIDHFQRHEKNLKKFHALTAINTQLVRKKKQEVAEIL